MSKQGGKTLSLGSIPEASSLGPAAASSTTGSCAGCGVISTARCIDAVIATSVAAAAFQGPSDMTGRTSVGGFVSPGLNAADRCAGGITSAAVAASMDSMVSLSTVPGETAAGRCCSPPCVGPFCGVSSADGLSSREAPKGVPGGSNVGYGVEGGFAVSPEISMLWVSAAKVTEVRLEGEGNFRAASDTVLACWRPSTVIDGGASTVGVTRCLGPAETYGKVSLDSLLTDGVHNCAQPVRISRLTYLYRRKSVSCCTWVSNIPEYACVDVLCAAKAAYRSHTRYYSL